MSAAEALWYRGFLYRGFDDTAEGVIEFYYLPEELFSKLPQNSEPKVVKEKAAPPLQTISAPENAKIAGIDAVDDLTGILILAQRGSLLLDELDCTQFLLNADPDRCSLLKTLAKETGLLRTTDQGYRPTRAAVKWLQQGRESQLRSLADAWSSSAWNDLCHTPGLNCEGMGWNNDPILARTTLLDMLPRTGEWFSLRDFVEHIKQNSPDFQRPDGNYDTWYIRDLESDEYVTGFDNWDQVEGRLMRFLVEGPCFWLGLVDTAVRPVRAAIFIA
jgi:hypothetical protein